MTAAQAGVPEIGPTVAQRGLLALWPSFSLFLPCRASSIDVA